MFVRIATRQRAQFPWATLITTFACIACFVALSLVASAGRQAFLREWGLVPERLQLLMALDMEGFLAAKPYVLFTSLFIHTDWLHLGGNLTFLLIFGLAAERALSARRFFALFVVCGALANLIGALTLLSSKLPIVGASGAISAIVGAYLALFPTARLGLVIPLGFFLEFVKIPAWILIGFWVLLQVVFTAMGPAFGAVVWVIHLIGFIAGMLFAILSRPALSKRWRNS